MTDYTHSRLMEAIGQLEALQKAIDNKYQYDWVEEILYDLRIVAERIAEKKDESRR